MVLLRYLWAAPASLVGLGLLPLAWACGARMTRHTGTLEIAGGRLGAWIARLPSPWAFDAITFGHVVYAVEAERLAACRAHERVHVRQYERWGPLFFPLYVGSSVLQWLTGRNPYWDNHFEREAYRVAPPSSVR